MSCLLKIVDILKCIITETKVYQDNLEVLKQKNKKYVITSKLSGTLIIGDDSTLIFRENGLLEDAIIVGNNIKVIPNGSQTIFKNCDFRGAQFSSSELFATNFGMVSDMTVDAEYNFTLKGINYNTYKPTGTNNYSQLEMMTKFMSNSDKIKIIINGDFFHYRDYGESLGITNANKLELCGTPESPGTLIMGFVLDNCNWCYFHHLNFIGRSLIHDFPPIYSSKSKLPQEINGITYTMNNSYNINDDSTKCGLVKTSAIRVNSDCKGFTFEHIHVEMRSNGIEIGTYTNDRTNANVIDEVTVTDCSFDHIYFQPIGLHCTNAIINRVTSNYCLQGIDISTGSNNVLVKNSTFTKCAMGPKQESRSNLFDSSHDNKLENCIFEITEDYFIIDVSQYILNIAEGANEDYFSVKDCTFNVNKNRRCSGIIVRSYGLEIEGSTFNLNIPNDNKYSFLQLFNVDSKTNYDPKILIDDTTVNVSDQTKIQYFAHANITDTLLYFLSNNLIINNAGTIDKYFTNTVVANCEGSNFIV